MTVELSIQYLSVCYFITSCSTLYCESCWKLEDGSDWRRSFFARLQVDESPTSPALLLGTCAVWLALTPVPRRQRLQQLGATSFGAWPAARMDRWIRDLERSQWIWYNIGHIVKNIGKLSKIPWIVLIRSIPNGLNFVRHGLQKSYGACASSERFCCFERGFAGLSTCMKNDHGILWLWWYVIVKKQLEVKQHQMEWQKDTPWFDYMPMCINFCHSFMIWCDMIWFDKQEPTSAT